MELAEWVDGVPFDPDNQKVTESIPHRAAVELIALAAREALGVDSEGTVVCDLNWYPVEDRSVYLSPDLMVVPRHALEERARSYRQVDVGGARPLVALEVPSESNRVSEFAAKLRRINAYGVVAYVVDVEPDAAAVLRYEAPSIAPTDWIGEPIPELGGITLDFTDGDLRVTFPGGRSATSTLGLLTDARREADEAAQRVRELEAKLRSLGHEPDAG